VQNPLFFSGIIFVSCNKTTIMKTNRKIVPALALMILLFFSCSKKQDVPAVTQSYVAHLDGTAAIPTNSSAAMAVFTGSYNSNTQKLSYSISYSDISPTQWEVKKGTSADDGPVVFSLGAVGQSPTPGAVTLNATQRDELDAGRYYVNIESLGFPEGEIRGRIIKQ
jgi:CHRD domain